MNRWQLALAGLRHGWRRHLGVLIGAIIASAVLVGALLVGDSVRGTLRDAALARIGGIDAVWAGGDRFVRDDLAARMTATGEALHTAALLRLKAVASTPSGDRRAHDVIACGVDADFFTLAPTATAFATPAAGDVYLNERLATQLALAIGDELVLRVEKPSAMPRGAALADEQDNSVALRVRVREILGADRFGRFGLEARQIPPFNAFLDRAWLAREVGQAGRANFLALRGSGAPCTSADLAVAADNALTGVITLDDLELQLDARPELVELRSRRVFLDAPIEAAARGLEVPALGALTWFVNELRAGSRSTPYSTVTALGRIGKATGSGGALDLTALVPDDLAADEIIINQWLADDLQLAVGAALELKYFVLADDLTLREDTRAFRVRGIVPMSGMAIDPEWMPDFPGLKDSQNCRDWQPGIPVDLGRIRDRDEEYWQSHHGAPKAFVSLAAGQALWGGRFGALTAVRVSDRDAPALEKALHGIDVRRLGLQFADVRTPALAASTATTDFAGLFIGLSFFLIGAAVMLIGLLFRFGVEQRRGEIGALLAIGFRPTQVRDVLLREAAPVALVGGVLGVPLGIAYTKFVLRGLASVWQDAVGSAAVAFHQSGASVGTGVAIAFVTAVVALWLALRRLVRQPAIELLASREEIEPVRRVAKPPWIARGLVLIGIAVAIAVLARVDAGSGPQAAGAFFGAGCALLLAVLAASRLMLRRLRHRPSVAHPSLAGLGLASAARRPGRSLATIGLLASGTFLVVSVGVHRLGPPSDPTRRDSGTGGFALIAQASLPVHENLDLPAGRDAFGLSERDLDGVRIVSLRQRDGDEASCLNLATAQSPRLYGVASQELAARGAFSFASALRPSDSPWRLLDELDADGAVPAIGDAASVTWALHKRVGDTLDYIDEQGQPFRVKIVATVAGSMLQGMLLIAERHFQDRFPSQSGYRAFFIDADPARAEAVSRTLSRALADVGLAVTSTSTRLAALMAVQNTYLAIFQLLGGLGVLLGTAGLGVVVLRNVLERRAELAALRAIGYRRRDIRRLVLYEHGSLVALGLGAGLIASLAAVLPGGRAALATVPLGLLAAIASCSVLCVLAATSFAIRGPLVDALRSE